MTAVDDRQSASLAEEQNSADQGQALEVPTEGVEGTSDTGA